MKLDKLPQIISLFNQTIYLNNKDPTYLNDPIINFVYKQNSFLADRVEELKETNKMLYADLESNYDILSDLRKQLLLLQEELYYYKQKLFDQEKETLSAQINVCEKNIELTNQRYQIYKLRLLLHNV